MKTFRKKFSSSSIVSSVHNFIALEHRQWIKCFLTLMVARLSKWMYWSFYVGFLCIDRWTESSNRLRRHMSKTLISLLNSGSIVKLMFLWTELKCFINSVRLTFSLFTLSHVPVEHAILAEQTRRLSDRIREHHPKWLYNGPSKTMRSSIVAHLVDNDHRVNVGDAFHPIFQVRVR